MIRPSDFRLSFAVILAVVVSGTVLRGQTIQNNDALAVWLEMQTDHIPIGQQPWAILTMKNVSDQPVTIRDSMYRVHVDGKDGEAPTTLIQRQITNRLRPGEAPLRGDQMVPDPTVEPNGSCVRKFLLAYLYDLSAPGKYTVYAEVKDPSSHQWLRTKTVTFEITAPAP